MSSILANPVPRTAKPAHLPAGERVLLPNIPWEIYTAIADARGDGGPRLTYDGGWLEIQMPGRLQLGHSEALRRFEVEFITVLNTPAS